MLATAFRPSVANIAEFRSIGSRRRASAPGPTCSPCARSSLRASAGPAQLGIASVGADTRLSAGMIHRMNSGNTGSKNPKKKTSQPVGARATSMRRDRNKFRVHPVPTETMAKLKRRPGANGPVPEDLKSLIGFFEGMEDGRERFRWTLRDSLDEILDGQRTGRWCYQHLCKTERTYLGTAIEINLGREFDISDGDHIDWSIRGEELDCKFSRDIGYWEIPMEMYICADHGEQSGKADFPALLVWMNDDASEWAAGLLRVSDERLKWKPDRTKRQYNRDNKRRIDVDVLDDIYWLWGGLQNDLPPNLLLGLSAKVRGNILKSGFRGQRRVDELFRQVQGRLVERAVVLTVGQQDDAPKRVRDARIHLRPEGIIILGHEKAHQRIASSLGLPEPSKGSWIATRVAPASETRGRFFLDGRWWKKATASDPEVAGPGFPKKWDALRTQPLTRQPRRVRST